MKRPISTYTRLLLFSILLAGWWLTASSELQAQEVHIVGDSVQQETEIFQQDTLFIQQDSIISPAVTTRWIPNSTRATWLAAIFPGGGQIYNRKYWKLPIIYGGFAACAYGLNWNNNMYRDYGKAYLDIMDKDPKTNSYYDLLPIGAVVDETAGSTYADLLRRQKDQYRRWRDMTIFAFIAVYAISIIDAYVDAELSDFDLTPDISMRVQPAVIQSQRAFAYTPARQAVGLQCSFRF
ncbi:MAG: DUF5683 domain-containing protein [Prevotellaceae bacterium]|jgi:hypothetical protein|nr:DUF5683 domain-containing protein [Prevotellaceae bacterium]